MRAHRVAGEEDRAGAGLLLYDRLQVPHELRVYITLARWCGIGLAVTACVVGDRLEAAALEAA